MTPTDPTEAIIAGSDLCVRCGLCCSGAVFDFVPISADEFEPMAALGLDPRPEPAGGFRFDLPCPRLEGTLCGIYEQRPATCRAFECKLLKRFRSGALSGDEALATVAEARKMIDGARSTLGETGSPIVPKRWTTLLKAMAGAAGDLHQAGIADGKALLELTILNRFLDRHFRLESQRIVKERLVDDE